MSILHRRSLAGVAGLLVAGVTGTSKAAELDSELLRMVDEFVAHIAGERSDLDAMTEEKQGAWHNERFVASWRGVVSTKDALLERIARTPAKSPQGLQAKARALIWLNGGTDAGPVMAIGDGLFESLLADVTGAPCRFRPARMATDVGGAA